MRPPFAGRRYRRGSVAPFPLPQGVDFADACQQVIDQLYEDIKGFNAIILDLPEDASALNRPELLRSAVQRPFTTVGASLVYADGLLQASALLYSLIQNHPFSDANKRTAYWGCAFFLQQCGYWSGEPFLSSKEAFDYEWLILDIAREGDDITQERRSARYTVEEIADRLDRIFTVSRRRPFSSRRARMRAWARIATHVRRADSDRQEE
jgi:death on curing protein